VRVAAGAFAPGLPRRALFLSPDHAVFINDVLIPIRYLINDATIAQQPIDEVTYWHVELPMHDVLFAEGLAAESYLDTGNRGAFANGGPARALHPNFARRVWDAEACAKLLRHGPALVAIRAMLIDRAEALGHGITRDAAPHLVVDDGIVWPSITGSMHHFRLPRMAREARLVSRAAIPAAVRADGTDHRRLGVAVSRIALDARTIPLADARLGAGWHAVEADGAGSNWRWTDGDARLDIAGARVLELDVVMTGHYWLGGQHAEAYTAVAVAAGRVMPARRAGSGARALSRPREDWTALGSE
jgi:hypothetical protein